MAASSLQPAGSGLLLIHHQRTSASQQLFLESSNVVSSSELPGIPGALGQREPGEVTWVGKHSGALHLQRGGRDYFHHPALWWEHGQHKQSFRFPELRESKEVLWLNKWWKLAWVEELLTPLDAERVSLPSTSNSTKELGSRRVAGYEGVLTAETVGYLGRKGQLSEAVDVLDALVQRESPVSTSVFYGVLKRCVEQRNLVLGRRVHALAVRVGYESNTFLANQILRMYAAHRRLQEAEDVFTRVDKPDVFLWCAAITGHAKHGEPKRAIQLYQEMCRSSVKPDSHVFVAALQACASAGDLESGRQVHADVLESSVEPNLFIWTCLVDMYAKCGRLEDARAIFDSLDTKDVVIWNAMMAGYAEHEQAKEAFSLYKQMQAEGVVRAGSFTFSCLLKACARVGALQQGMQLHSQILERRMEADVVVGTCLVDMYAKCGRLEDARTIFDSLTSRNVVTWNAMIAGYTEQGLGQAALAIYARMEQEGVITADVVTFACLLKACAKVGALQEGKRLHSQILERGLETDIMVGTSLVDMYAKCDRLEDALHVFDAFASRNVVTWNAMIAGYADHGLGQEALALYSRMEQEGVVLADTITFTRLLKVCAAVAALQQGKKLHAQILERGLGDAATLGNCLVDMYAKCGRVQEARKVFESLPTKDVVTWTMMISGLGQCNEGQKAIECFEEMLRSGVQADETTFTCLLVACSHEGLVEEGRQFFKAMVGDCGITPTIEHYTCMVDLLGRAGHLDEAEKMLLSFESNDVGFTSLLNACRSHGDIERANRCFETLIKNDSQNAAAYIVMGNMYADAGRWSDVQRIERLRKSAGAGKKPAVAGIEVDSHVHTFVVGKERGDISSKVRTVNTRLKEEGGHLPHTELVLKRLSANQKEDDLCGHAEKLALAYGLMNTPDGTPLLVTKNLRMCGDCHSSTEVMSRIEKREIVVRDAHRVHRFVDGSCLCGGRP